jgi:hypothetical protein
MRRFPRFTEVESERLVDVAVEAIAERCSKDAGYLRFFIRDYLGIAEAAFAPVYERCQEDPTYLTGIAWGHVLGLRERAVLDLLQEAMDKQSLAERLGFDPLDPRRAEAYRRATSYISRSQIVVLAAAFLVSALMLLFPPWIEEHWRTQAVWLFFPGVTRVELLESRPAGHGSWSSHQSHTDVEAKLASWPGGAVRPAQDGQETVYRLDFRLLAIQFLLLWSVSAVLVVVLRNKKRSYSDYLRKCGASMLPTQTGGNVESANPPDNGGIQTFPIQGFAGHPDR